MCGLVCPGGSVVKNPSVMQERHGRSLGWDQWIGKIPWRRKWQPMPVFLPGKSHGQRSLEAWGRRVGHDLETKTTTWLAGGAANLLNIELLMKTTVEVYLIYNVVLTTVIQHSYSFYIFVYINACFIILFSIRVYYGILNLVSCAIQ